MLLFVNQIPYGDRDLSVVTVLPLDIGEHGLQGLLYGLLQALQRAPVFGDKIPELIEVALQEGLLRERRQQARHVFGNGIIAEAQR